VILTVGAYKGGTGKTTTSVMLALQFARSGPTVLVDADRQGSASTWHREAMRKGYAWPESLTVVGWHEPMTLPPVRHVVIDCGPGDPDRFRAAMRMSDTVIVTAGARIADAVQLGATVGDVEKVAAERPLEWGVLMTLVRLRTRAASTVTTSIETADLPLLRTIVPSLQRYADAFGTVPERFDAYVDVLGEIKGGSDAR